MGIGDEVMVTGQVRMMQERDPRRVRIEYEKPRWMEVWNNNPRIARPEEKGDFQVLRPRDQWRRPYTKEKTPTLWTWQLWPDEWGGCAPKGELYLTKEENDFAVANMRRERRVIVEPRIKPGASPNKDWGINNWVSLVKLLRAEGVQVTYIGANRYPQLDGAESLTTPTIRHAAAILSRARLLITSEGALHHIAAAIGTPAIVIFGGYIAPSVTGYAEQTNFFTGGGEYPLGCGVRVPCAHCADAMAKITPAEVVEKAVGLL